MQKLIEQFHYYIPFRLMLENAPWYVYVYVIVVGLLVVLPYLLAFTTKMTRLDEVVFYGKRFAQIIGMPIIPIWLIDGVRYYNSVDNHEYHLFFGFSMMFIILFSKSFIRLWWAFIKNTFRYYRDNKTYRNNMKKG